MSKFILDARNQPMRDSLELWAFLADHAKQGEAIAVNCSEMNKSVFEFHREYCLYTDQLEILVNSDIECTSLNYLETAEIANSPLWNRDSGNSPFFPLRLSPEPLFVLDHKYVCFHAEALSHTKKREALMECKCTGRGVSLGVSGERIVTGSKTFFDRSFVDVARLLYYCEGVIGVLSCIALFGALLGKKVVCVGYEGRRTEPAIGIKSMRPPRVLFENNDADSIVKSVGSHIGEGWISL